MSKVIINEMVWTELDKYIGNVKIAIVPVGSCEQHGPNTTFSTDTERAYEFCKLLAEEVGEDIAIFPPVTYGLSYHHMGFPGTVTLRVDTMVHVLTDIALSISKHGIKKILFVNGHGGNRVALDSAILTLKHEHNISAYWTAMGTNLARKELENQYKIPKVIGHACEVETSQSMYLAPWIVSDNLKAGELHQDSAYFRKVFTDGNAAWDWKKDASENGALGDATRSSVEMGKLITDIAIEYIKVIIAEIIDRD